MRVSFITSAADMQHTMASQSSRRAVRAGSTASICASMNNIVTRMMSPLPISSMQSRSDSGSASQLEAACMLSARPGSLTSSSAQALAITPRK